MKKDYLSNLMERIISSISVCIIAVYLSNRLSQSTYGFYVYIITIINLCTLFASLGINNYGSKTYLINKTKDAYSAILSIQLLSSLIFISIFTIFAIIYKMYIPVYVIIVLNTVFLSIQPLWYNIAKGRIGFNNIIYMISTIINLCLILMFVHGDDSSKILFLIITLINFLKLILVFLSVKTKYIPNRNHFSIKIYKEYLGMFFPFFCISLYTIIDKLMVSNLAGLEEVAVYSNGVMILKTSLMLIIALIPIIVVKNTKEQEKIKENINEMLSITIYISIYLMFIFINSGVEIVEILFNEKYFSVSYILVYGSILIPIISISIIIANGYFIPNGKNKTFAKSVLFGAVVNVTLNLLLIPKYGAFGGVLATITTEFIIVAIMIGTIKDIIYKRYLANTVVKALVINIFATTLLYNVNIPSVVGSLIIKNILLLCINLVIVLIILKRHSSKKMNKFSK